MARIFDCMKTTLLLLIIICNERSITVCMPWSFQSDQKLQTPAKLPGNYLWPPRKPLTKQTDKGSGFFSVVSNREDDLKTLTTITIRSAGYDFMTSHEKSLRIRRQIITRTITEPSVVSLVELELEMSQKGNPEPGPEWPTAIQAWGKAWDLHVYVFAVLYILITIASGYGLAYDLFRNQGIKGLKLTLFLTFLFLGSSRGIMLLVDPYNSRGILDLYSSYVTWSLGFPCVLTALGLLLLVFGEATSMEIAPPRFQKLSTALGIMACNIIVVLGVDIVFLLAKKFISLLIICHIYFVLFGIILTVGYCCVGCKLSCNSAASVYGDTGILRLKMFVFTLAMLNGLFIGIQVFSAFDFVLHPGALSAWPWYAVQTSLRALEVSMCLVMLLIAFNNRVRSSPPQMRTSFHFRNTVTPFQAWEPSEGQKS